MIDVFKITVNGICFSFLDSLLASGGLKTPPCDDFDNYKMYDNEISNNRSLTDIGIYNEVQNQKNNWHLQNPYFLEMLLLGMLT